MTAPTATVRSVRLVRRVRAPRDRVFDAWTKPELLKAWMSTTVMEPACPRSPKVLDSSESRLRVPCDSAHAVVRFFSGEPDPSNPARFVIRYEVDGVRGLLIGCLSPDDTVTLRLACGPGTLN